MIWFLLQMMVAIIWNSTLDHPGTEWAGLYCAGLLCFSLVWPFRSSELATLIRLSFTSLLGFSLLVLLAGGPLPALGLLWPALMLRLEEAPETRRLLLVAVQWLLAAGTLNNDCALYLNLALILASLAQLSPGRVARIANTAALTVALGPLCENLLFPQMGAPAALILQTTLLLALPQLGLRVLDAQAAKGGRCSCSSTTPACSTEPFTPLHPPFP